MTITQYKKEPGSSIWFGKSITDDPLEKLQKVSDFLGKQKEKLENLNKK